jgi:hypothetical protein
MRSNQAARLVVQRKDSIMKTFPRDVASSAREGFILKAQAAIKLYVAWLPPGENIKPSGLSAHRPINVHRHVLIGDLFDAYITARGDNLEARGFILTANAVLTAAGLQISITDHDFVHLKEQRQPFNEYCATLSAQRPLLKLPKKSRKKEK